MSDESYSYDAECETLAEHFLSDLVDQRDLQALTVDLMSDFEALRSSLSQAIQDAVEEWFERSQSKLKLFRAVHE